MGFFKKLFSSEPKLPPVDLSLIGTDVHSHFIPGIDDGAKTIEESVALVKAFEAMGYKKVITTPHVMSDYYRNTPEIILGGLEKVRAALVEEGVTCEIEAAAEYYLDIEFEDKIEAKELLTFGDNYVLFELPFISEPPMLSSAIFNMQTAGYKPVLAHVERYTFWHNDYQKYEELFDKGVVMQLNINSLTGMYSPQVKKIAERLVEDNYITMIGSDCHNLRHVDMMQSCLTNKHLHQLANKEDLVNKQL